MGVRFPSVQSNTVLNANIAINSETIVCTTPPLTLPLDFATVILPWSIVHSTGASTTTARYRIYRGTTLTGTLVYDTNLVSVTASTGVCFSGIVFDTPGAASGQQYTLSAINNGSTGLAGIQTASLIAFAL